MDLDRAELDDQEAVEEAPLPPDPLRALFDRAFEQEPWRESALCRGEDVDLFFGMPNELAIAADAREHDVTERFCSRCPVALACRDFARRHHERGMWGGEGEPQRAAAGFGHGELSRGAERIRDAIRFGPDQLEDQ